MNLVKAQAIANDLQIPDLQKYADGFNPNLIPPWIAAGVIQEKTATAQKLANMQGAAQGEQPSVKEQIEQKAGLMALQQQMKQQSQGGMPLMGSMPVPENTPQPKSQPQTFMAASGGLARLPVRFNFDGGGIVAFSGEDGSTVKRSDNRAALDLMAPLQADVINAKNMYESAVKSRDQDAAQLYLQKLVKAQRALDEVANKNFAGSASDAIAVTQKESTPWDTAPAAIAPKGLPQALPKAPAAPVAGYDGADGQRIAATRARTGMSDAAMRQGVAPMPGPAGAKPPVNDLASALSAMREQQAPAGGPAGGFKMPVNPDIALARASANDLKTAAPTTEEVIAQSNKLMPDVASEEAQKALYAQQQKRYDDLMAQYEKSKPSGWDNLVRVFGQAAQSKGLSGLGPAYTANKESQRLQDLTMANKLNALRAETEKSEQEGAMKTFEKRSDLYKDLTNQYMQNLRSRATDLASIANTSQSAINTAIQSMTSLEVAKIHAAAANRPGETERLLDKYVTLKAQDPTGKLAAQFLDTIGQLKGAGRADPGLKDPAYKAAIDAANMMQRQADATTDPAKKQKYQAQADAKKREAEGYLRGGNRGSDGVNSGNTSQSRVLNWSDIQ